MTLYLGDYANVNVGQKAGAVLPQLVPAGWEGAIAQWSLHAGNVSDGLTDRSGNGRNLSNLSTGNTRYCTDIIPQRFTRAANWSYTTTPASWYQLLGPMTVVCRVQYLTTTSDVYTNQNVISSGFSGADEVNNYSYYLGYTRDGNGVITSINYFHEHSTKTAVSFNMTVSIPYQYFFLALRRTAGGEVTLRVTSFAGTVVDTSTPLTMPTGGSSGRLGVRAAAASIGGSQRNQLGVTADMNMWDKALTDNQLDFLCAHMMSSWV